MKYLITLSDHGPKYPKIVLDTDELKTVREYLARLDPETAARTKVYEQKPFIYTPPQADV